jgi:hypothetical protein
VSVVLRHDSRVFNRLPSQAFWNKVVAGKAQNFTIDAVKAELIDEGICGFKVGWTSNPCQRIDTYKRKGSFSSLIVLWAS